MRCTFKTVFYVNGSKERNGFVVVDICMSYDKMFCMDRVERNLHLFLLLFLWTFIGILPSDNLIYYFLLLQATSSQIDTCRFDAFMPHKVCKQGNVVELLQEILGITMAERVRVHHFFIQAILHRIVLQLLWYASCRDALAKAIEEEITTCTIGFLRPLFCFCAQRLGDIDTAYFGSGAEVRG